MSGNDKPPEPEIIPPAPRRSRFRVVDGGRTGAPRGDAGHSNAGGFYVRSPGMGRGRDSGSPFGGLPFAGRVPLHPAAERFWGQFRRRPWLTQGLLALLMLLLLAYLWGYGLLVAAVLVVDLIAHEYGHVFAMRRHGHRATKIYLVPFFGGLAVGDRAYRGDAEAVEVLLMGPLFGFLLGAIMVGLGLAFALPWALDGGYISILLNGLNLLPVLPLDGGRTTLRLLRPLGYRISRRILTICLGLAILGGIVYGLGLLLMLLLVYSLIALSTGQEFSGLGQSFSPRGRIYGWGAYLGLVLLHGAALLTLRPDWRAALGLGF